MKVNANLKAGLVIGLAVSSLLLGGFGFYGVIHSPLFTVRVVEVSDLSENSPVDAQTITDLAAVPIDSTNLFSLKLEAIERRILMHPWIRGVTISKHFPQTVSITVVFRDPKALLQRVDGSLVYVDSDGKTFGKISMMSQPDLPIISGTSVESETDSAHQIAQALKILDAWNDTNLAGISQVASLHFDSERGIRALVTYPLARSQNLGRVMVDLGQYIDADQDALLGRLRHVFTYLTDNAISAKEVWADLGKKIVVKIARSS